MQQLRSALPAGNNPNGHSNAEIKDALVGKTGARRWEFRYRLLDLNGAVKDESLDGVISCSVSQDWLAEIKRTATFKIRDDGEINFLSDRIQPVARLLLPPYGPNDWTEWPLGTFILSSPARQADRTDQVTRQVQGYDFLQILSDDVTTARYTVTNGTSYSSAINTLLSGFLRTITTSTATLPIAREWEPGTKKLTIINELLAAINHNSLSFDENGVAQVRSYTAPGDRAEEYVYADDDESLIVPEMEQTLDLFSIPNKWTLVVSDPDRVALVSTYTNTNPASPTSTVSRGRTITYFETEQDAADQTALDAKVQRLAFESSQVFEQIEFTTGLNPLHSGNDVYRLTYGALAIDAKYSEQSWSMELKAGAQMRHRARRVVSI